MEKDIRENYDPGNGNSQDDKNPNLFLENEGFPTYGKDGVSETDNSLDNYNDQEGSVDDTDFSHNPEKNPNPDEPDLEEDDENEEYEDQEEYEEDDDTGYEEEEDFEDEIIPEDEINPDEKKEYYLKANGKIFNIFFE